MLRTLLLFTALGMLSLNAFAADDPAKPDTKPEPKPEVKVEEKATVEVYRLKNVEPNDALEALNALVGHHVVTRRAPRNNPDDPLVPGGGNPGGGGRGNRGDVERQQWRGVCPRQCHQSGGIADGVSRHCLSRPG